MPVSLWTRALLGLALTQAVAGVKTSSLILRPTIRGLQAADSSTSGDASTSTAAACPSADSPLAGTKTPALTPLCPSTCVDGGVCVYYPKGFESNCQRASDRTCLHGDTCAFECFPFTGTESLGWILTLYNDPSVIDDVLWTNYEKRARSRTEYRTPAINASLVTQWIGGLPYAGNDSGLFITGNEPANNVPLNDNKYKDFLPLPPGSSIVPFAFPPTFFEDVTDYTWIRLENIKFPAIRNAKELAFPNLWTIFLRNTMLTSFPLANSSLPAVNELDLSANQIPEIIPSMIPESVSFLNLSSNAISNVAKGALSTNITTLDLTTNSIQTLANGTLPLGLQYLSVIQNLLTDIPADVASMTDLTKLYLGDNFLREIPENALPPSVEWLSIENCSLTDVPKALRSMTQLKNLYLSRNDLSRDPNFSVLPEAIELLYLNNVQLQKIPAEFKSLLKLRELDLSNNPKAMVDLSSLPAQLEYIYLMNNSLEAIPDAVKNLGIQVFVLDENPLGMIAPGSLPASTLATKMSSASFRVLPSGTLPPKVDTFVIHNSALEEVPEDLRTCEKLLDIRIVNCALQHFDVGDTMPHTEWIFLRDNRIASFSGNFPSVVELRLANNTLSSFNDVNATALLWLDLSLNNLSAFPESIFRMSKLQMLNLTGNPIRDFKPTADQAAFLGRIESVLVDQSMLASDCEPSDSVKLGKHSLCLQQEVTTPPAPNKSWKWLVPLNLVLAFVLALLIYAFWRRRKLQKQRLNDLAIEQANLAKQQQDQTTISIWADGALLRDRIDEDLVTRVRLLGAGMFGEVWLAAYKNEKVALKQLKQVGSHGGVVDSEAINDFVHEIKLLQSLTHPSVVQFVGVMWSKESDIAMITEYMDGGDLRSYLDQHPKIYGGWTTQMVRIALQVTEAIVYLHSLDPLVIHRDLKSRNVLLDKAMRAKLSDFGVSRYKLDDDTMTAAVGTVRWVAPEVLAGQRYNETVDIYALGVIFSEMDTHKLPFEGLSDESGGELLSDSAIAGMVVTGALRVGVSKSCPSEIRSLVERCTGFDPAARPRATDVANELRAMLEGSSSSTATSSATSSGIFRSSGSPNDQMAKAVV